MVSDLLCLSQLPCRCWANNHTSGRPRLRLWCLWPPATPFVLPARVWCSDMPVCLLYLSRPYLTTATLQPSRHTTHTHTQVISPQPASHNQCHVMLCGGISFNSPNKACKIKCSVFLGLMLSCLFSPSSLIKPSHHAVKSYAEEVHPKQTLNLSCFIISSVATEWPTKTCRLIDLTSRMAVMRDSLPSFICLVFKVKKIKNYR